MDLTTQYADDVGENKVAGGALSVCLRIFDACGK